MELGENTCRIPKLAFSWRAICYDWITRAIFGTVLFFGLLTLFLLYWVFHRGSPFAVSYVIAEAVWILLPGYLLSAKVASGFAVRKVWVAVKDSQGEAGWSLQEWWRRDEMKWPDAWRILLDGTKTLVIDATEEPYVRFTPWINELKQGKGDPSPAEFAKQALAATAIKTVLKPDKTLAEHIQTGIIALVIVASFLGIIVAAGQTSEALSTPIQEAQSARAQE
jgi:hypothetical protein